MKKFSNKLSRLAAIIAVTAAMFGSVLSADAATVKTTDSVKLREGTSTDTKHLDTIGKGVELKSDDSKEADGYTWYKVNYNGKDGYIRGDFAELVESEEEAPEEEEAPVEAGMKANIGGDNVNVRAEASEDGEIVATAESGASYDVVGETTDDNGNTWYKINVDGNEGFVNANDVSITSGEAEMAEEPESTDATEIANVISSRIIPGDVNLKGMTIDESTLNEWASGNYYVLYTTDNKGGDNWYLYSLSDKQFEQIADLHANPDEEKKESKGGVSIIVVIVMAIIIVALVVALVVTNIKKNGGNGGRKSSKYDSYDDDEDDYDDEEDEDDYDDEYDDDEYDDEEEEYEPAPKKRGFFGGKKDKKKSKKYDDDDDYYDDDDYEDDEYDDDDYEDDDYEFDFLNMDK